MSTIMTTIVEKRIDNKWQLQPDIEDIFDYQNYSWYAFLAGVRNYDCCEPISEPKGLPDDSEHLNQINDGFHTNGITYGIFNSKETNKDVLLNSGASRPSYLTLQELLDFDYDKTFENQRDKHKTEIMTYRENLGQWFFDDLDKLKAIDEPQNVRIIFWFN